MGVQFRFLRLQSEEHQGASPSQGKPCPTPGFKHHLFLTQSHGTGTLGPPEAGREVETDKLTFADPPLVRTAVRPELVRALGSTRAFRWVKGYPRSRPS